MIWKYKISSHFLSSPFISFPSSTGERAFSIQYIDLLFGRIRAPTINYNQNDYIYSEQVFKSISVVLCTSLVELKKFVESSVNQNAFVCCFCGCCGCFCGVCCFLSRGEVSFWAANQRKGTLDDNET